MTAHYAVPAESFKIEYEVKKSQFISLAFHVASRDEAMTALALAREQYPDARHHCWAYLIGAPAAPVTVAMSDDGEPSGTAGKPILNILQHKDVGDIMLIVVRYFGGIKLGAGGLVRAYSHAAQLAVDALPRRQFRQLTQLQVTGDFSSEQPLRHWLQLHDGKVDGVEYGDRITASIALEERDVAEFKLWTNANNLLIVTS
ncbi:IMPACT family member YigZ [Thalassocella blandensis]|nr:IMPACT family member YigZ [Thalassocella blandensis]